MNAHKPATVTPDVASESVIAAAQAKKARKNPARRKAERAKSEVQLPSAVQSLTRDALPPPKLHRSQSEQQSASVQQTAKRPSLQRVGTAPATPKPIRATQAEGTNMTSIALAAPAIVTGGLLGCAAGAAMLAGAGIWHGYAGTDNAVLAVRAAKLCLDNLADETVASLKAGTYSAEEATDMLRRTTLGYASTIPGGAAYVERIFHEVRLVRTVRGAEVDKVLSRCHAELRSAAKQGASPDLMRGIIVQQLARLSSVAGSSLRDVADRNPCLKPYQDGAVRAMEGSPQPKVPTMKVNIKLRQKPES